MAIQDSNDANIYDAEAINWRMIVYPVAIALVVLIGGFTYYFYQQNLKDQLEERASAALQKAKTPEEMVKVADEFPGTFVGTRALLSAGEAAFNKPDYAGAIQDYQRIVKTEGTDPELHESAQVGLAATFEASGKLDEAAATYLDVAHLGKKSFYAPYAYFSAARIFEQKGDKAKQHQVLLEATSLDADSPFVKAAQEKLKELDAPAISTVGGAPAKP